MSEEIRDVGVHVVGGGGDRGLRGVKVETNEIENCGNTFSESRNGHAAARRRLKTLAASSPPRRGSRVLIPVNSRVSHVGTLVVGLLLVNLLSFLTDEKLT